MIVITNNEGQLCNKLILFAHCVATGIETGHRVVHLAGKQIMEAATLDPQIMKRLGVTVLPWELRSPFQGGWWTLTDWLQAVQGTKPFRNCLKKSPEESRLYVEQCFGENARKRRLFMIRDWFFRNPDAFFKHRAEILKLLALKENFYTKPREIISGIRRNHPGAEVIGVHIRRGDYKTYENGRWFFTDEDYLFFMRQAAAAAPVAPVFWVCSNEPVNLEFFQHGGMNVVAGPGHKIEDLAALSLCDKLMGPPSTYSWWAAFVSDIPAWHIADSSKTETPLWNKNYPASGWSVAG